MKSTVLIALLTSLFFTEAKAQENLPHQGFWQIGLGFGELPVRGSFKPSISVGYHFSDKIYTGIIYQLKDKISRDGSSFNAKSAGLKGLVSSSENVSQRFMFQFRYTPVKFGPYLSTGIVFNGKDSEIMHFDERTRTISGEETNGTIQITQTRPAGWGLALGIGYQYTFKNGFSLNTEWTPAWFQYPSPEYSFAGDAVLTMKATNELKTKMDEGFKSSVTNMYKIFHIGIAYQFK